MATKIFMTIVFSLLLFGNTFGEPEKHQCALEWSDLSSGKVIPKTSIASEVDNIYIIRGQAENDNSWTVGYFDPETDRAFIPNLQNTSSAFNMSSFQILNNVHGCQTNWVEPTHEDADGTKSFAVPVDYDNVGNGMLVGRTEDSRDPWGQIYGSSKLLGGQVVNSLKRIYVPELNVTRTRDDYFVLISYTTRMELKLVDFAFNDDLFDGTLQIVGLDDMTNNSPATITQTVIHTTTITQRMKMTTTSVSLTVATHVDAKEGYDYFLFFDKKTTSTTTSSSVIKQNSIENEETSEVKLTRVISVPQFSTVQVCSVLQTKDNFDTTWRAMAVFKSPGMKADAILDWVKTQNGWRDLNFEILGDTVRTEIQGRIEGSFATGSKFLVTTGSCQETILQINGKRTFLLAKEYTKGTRFGWKKYSDIIRS